MAKLPPYNHELHDTVFPTMVPQVTDPRIIVQTFNAPDSPIFPSTLPKPQMELNIDLPAPIKEPTPIKIIRKSKEFKQNARNINDVIEDDVEQAFLSALDEGDKIQGGNFQNILKEIPKQKITLISSVQDKMVNNMLVNKKVQQITDKINLIFNQYNIYKQQITKKLENLNLAQQKWQDQKYNIIV